MPNLKNVMIIDSNFVFLAGGWLDSIEVLDLIEI